MTEIIFKKLEEVKQVHAKNEKIAVGHMIQDDKAAILVTKILHEKYFVTNHAAHIFKIVKECVETGKPIQDIFFKINSITESDWRNICVHSSITREQYLRDCRLLACNLIGIISAAEGIFAKIREQYYTRELFFLCEDTLHKILDTSTNKDLITIVNSVSNLCTSLVEPLEERKERNHKQVGNNVLNAKDDDVIKTGYQVLDEIIGGFQAGQLVTIGAATGVGKSAFAINLTLNIADQGHAVDLYSFEMDEKEVYNRIISIVTGISSKDKSSAEERYNAGKKHFDSTKHDIEVFTKHVTDLSKFYSQCRISANQDGVKVVIIDYVQLIHLVDYSKLPRVAEIEKITSRLKNIASELKITIIILSQLSREHQKRENKQPVLSDLRDSGSIEQDSNIVIFLHKSEIQPAHFKPFEKLIHVTVAKNRNGECREFALKYLGNTTKFMENNK